MAKQTGTEQDVTLDEAPEPAGGAAISLQLPLSIVQAIDDWAAGHHLPRAEATHRLIEFGLEVAAAAFPPRLAKTTRAIELAASQIGQLIDPDAPSEERHRRIDRLTKGPPEFVEARVDLPKPKI